MSVMNIEPEQRQGLIYSIGLHLALVLLLFMSTQQTSITPPKGIAIQAEIMDLDEYMKNLKKPNKEKPVQEKPKPQKPKPEIKKPEPKPEPKKPEPVKQETKPKPKPVIKPKIDQTQRQEKSERMKKLEELRRKRQEEENKPAPKPVDTKTEVKPPEGTQTAQPVGSANGDEKARRTKLTLYEAAIKSAVKNMWAQPVGTPSGLKCQIKVRQIPGGGVIDVKIGTPCNASAVVRNSIINAVKKADPLPYTGFEEVFDREVNFNFEYQGD